MGAAVAFDLSMMNGQDFGYREVNTRGHFCLLCACFSYTPLPYKLLRVALDCAVSGLSPVSKD